MKAFKVVFKHGHFIEVNTNKRILPRQGGEFIITANEEDFERFDYKIATREPLDIGVQAKTVFAKYGEQNVIKIRNRGEKLVFVISNSQRVPGDESRKYVLVCHLLEDLYVYHKKNKPERYKFENWKLASCVCEVDSCADGGLQISEKITADSLNKLFSHSVNFYFPLQRSGTTNAYDNFFVYVPELPATIKTIELKIQPSIRNLIESLLLKLKKQEKSRFL